MRIIDAGFGALHTALNYPDTFSKTMGLSSALIIHDIAHKKPGEAVGVANYEYYRECFGDLDHVEESRNISEMSRKLKTMEMKGISSSFPSFSCLFFGV